jgi:hypothetical protein
MSQAAALAGLALEAAALSLGHTAPDSEPLIVLERVLQALCPDFAAAAHPLSLPCRPSLLWKKSLRIRLRAQCPVLPAQFVNVFRTDEHLRQRDDDLRHSVSSLPNRSPDSRLLPMTARITPMKLHPRVLLHVKRGR